MTATMGVYDYYHQPADWLETRRLDSQRISRFVLRLSYVWSSF